MPRRLNTAEDVWKRVAISTPDACWLWIGAVSSGGYGQFYFGGRRHTAHRVAYELKRGPIDPELQLDHLCRNRRCCNPAHLEPVTGKTNVERSPIHNGAKTHCPNGHKYTANNTRINKASRGRVCCLCDNADSRERKRRRRAALIAQGLTTRGTPRKRPQAGRDGGPGCPGPTGAS